MLYRVIVIVLIYTKRTELECYSQSYSDRVDIHGLTELNSGAIVRVIVIVYSQIVLIYRF